MTIRFTQLKIAGFKSFSDPITLEILPGLTGIIGPNGCGKSNIVEAIRWVMGESSARSLRGGEMDDVIFAGTARRAARNIAEVALTIEGTEMIAPAPFQQQDQLQISRQLERGSGSQYRINNKVQRARDVQTFFADLGSGPRSSAIISQNRIAQLISASPEERRQVLEEAAGIAGLYSRRREAELKLKATEENLARLNDLQQQLISLIESLNEQSSQATIYRRLSTELREAETTLQSLYFQRAIRSLYLFEQKQIQADNAQKDAEYKYTEQQTLFKSFEEKIPQLRQQEIQARTQWDHERNATRFLQEQRNKITEQLQQLQERIQEATEQQIIANNRVEKTQADLNQVHINLKTTEQNLLEHPEKERILQSNIADYDKQLARLTVEIQKEEKTFEEQQKQHQTITQQYEQAKQAKQAAEIEYQKIVVEYQGCLEALPKKEEINNLANAQDHAQQHLKTIQTQKQESESRHNEAKLQASHAQHHAQQVEQAYTQLATKIKQQTEKQQQLLIQRSNFETQLQTLQKQSLTEQQKQQFAAELSELQKTYFSAKENTEITAQYYQDAIKTHLETESANQQATEIYNNRQKNLSTTQQAFQQAQKNLTLLAKQIDKAKTAIIADQILQDKKTELNLQKDQVTSLQDTIQNLTAQYQETQEATEQAQKNLYQHEAEQQKLQAKRDGLALALSHDQEEKHTNTLPAVLDSITIPSDLIVAVAALFDETLESPVSIDTQTGWVPLPPSHSVFPASIRKLSEIIPPPPALQRAFDHIGMVETVEQGQNYFQTLTFGQSLMTKEGDIWRWDGYHQKAGLQSRAAQRLLQKENLKQSEEALTALKTQYPALKTQHQKLQEQFQAIKAQLTEKQALYKTTEQAFQRTRQEFLSLQNRSQAAQTQFDALHPAYSQAQQEFNDKQKTFEHAQKEAEIPKPDDNIVEQSQKQLQRCKEAAQQAQQDLQTIEHQLSTLKDQQHKQLSEDQQNLIRLETLQEKQTQLQIELEQLEQGLVQDQEQQTRLENPQQALSAQQTAQKNVQELEQQILAFQQESQIAEQALSVAQKNHQAIKENYIQHHSRIETLQPRCEDAKKYLENKQQEFIKVEELYAARPELDIVKANLYQIQETYKNCKEQEEKERLSYHLLLNEKDNLLKQKEALATQFKEWQARLSQAQEEATISLNKITQLQSEYDLLNQKLPVLEKQLTSLKETEAHAGELYQAAQQQLIQLERDRTEAQKQLQQAEQNAHKTRENLLKAQAKQEQAEALLEQLKNNIEPSIQEHAKQQTDMDIGDAAERKLKTIISENSAERDALGAVNLRAEIEREEKQEQLNNIEKEYTELSTAIQQLRDSIQKLNQQGKEKLHAIFNEVNQHFQDLFTRMFNGGSAYLKLLAHEDPLQSGLEIYAQPPGKKLSTLSLLSGGEQALTALSLVFAVSRCNPVPICILDEVDAPLDDPNVERFCSLISDMTAQAGTRFLVVTHHQLTMSHMNRLYGVTMQERGVSQIISIDLEHAVQMQQDKHVEQFGLI
ncbi:Chromosome segregation ATPase Smc (Smc) (PDB:5XG3) [Commensalibacter communis]|uniref:AAA family ATPase n=1 Tax=Commensalibacter communis TaxID=2972786 RepID=UPI0022FF8AF3|nr:AAA family ATPase [Commensalibacter communis]CAI3929837.1 Chromosome segregation ATPase Smc (Smc) (PDB:5XG3) [Commensalibacter communis]